MDGIRHRTVPCLKVIEIFVKNPVVGVIGDLAGGIASQFFYNTIKEIEFLTSSMDTSDPYTTYFVLDYIFVTTSSYGRTYSLLDEPILRKVG